MSEIADFKVQHQWIGLVERNIIPLSCKVTKASITHFDKFFKEPILIHLTIIPLNFNLILLHPL